MQQRNALSSPLRVRDCLRLVFSGKTHEAFVANFLDAQHRVIESAELFRGTLTQSEKKVQASQPLAGLVVVEIGHGVAAPFAGRVLSGFAPF